MFSALARLGGGAARRAAATVATASRADASHLCVATARRADASRLCFARLLSGSPTPPPEKYSPNELFLLNKIAKWESNQQAELEKHQADNTLMREELGVVTVSLSSKNSETKKQVRLVASQTVVVLGVFTLCALGLSYLIMTTARTAPGASKTKENHPAGDPPSKKPDIHTDADLSKKTKDGEEVAAAGAKTGEEVGAAGAKTGEEVGATGAKAGEAATDA